MGLICEPEMAAPMLSAEPTYNLVVEKRNSRALCDSDDEEPLPGHIAPTRGALHFTLSTVTISDAIIMLGTVTLKPVVL